MRKREPVPPTVPPAPLASDFVWSGETEPHAIRRKAILAAHPEIRDLFGFCWRTKYTVALAVGLQLSAAVFSSSLPLWQMLVLAWALGGTLTSNLFLAAHEVSHNLAFESPTANKLLGMVANWPIGIPFSIKFAQYHMDHHYAQARPHSHYLQLILVSPLASFAAARAARSCELSK